MPLLARVVIAIVLGVGVGWVAPEWVVRVFATFNELFGEFLGFIVPLIILGFVAPGIADIGRGAGKMLLITVVLSYGFMIFSGFFLMLGFDETTQGVMIALYIAMDSFGTATNVTGDGAIAVLIDKLRG